MNFHHAHNLVDPKTVAAERSYGIRVSLPNADTLNKLLGSDWERFHWYPSERQRDKAYDTMALRHGYYRETDTPTQVLEKVTR